MSNELFALRAIIRDHYLIDEATLAKNLISTCELNDDIRKTARAQAANFVRLARANAERSGLIDKFLQEYGLSTAEGVTLMRLAEALLRTPDATTANALIEDKLEAGDWSAHKGKSPFPLVNFSTRALMLTAAWLDDIEAKDPLRRMAAATKEALDRLGEPVIRASVAQAMRIMGEHFVLGETIDDAMRRGEKFAKINYLFSFDMLGEAAHTANDAQRYFNDYADAIKAIAVHSNSERPADNPGISVKLSALHPRYEYGKKERVLTELGARVRQLAIQAKNANMGFNIDAEEADRLDLSLDIIELLMRDPALDDWDGFGVVVQAYQRRAMPVLDWLAALARETDRKIMVRLVKGAYWDSEIKRAQVMGLESYPVFTRKVLTDISYLACARKLFAATDVFYPQFATHNALTATTVREMAGGFEEYELQRLHGMGEALHDSLIEHGARSRIYAPVGGHKELLPYLVRRLLENGANSSFVNQLIDPDLSVDDVVADPVDEIAEIEEFANPHIPAPRDHLKGDRLAAMGWDETDPTTAARLEQNNRDHPLPGLVTNESVGATANLTDFANSSPASNHNVDLACRAARNAQTEWAARTDRADILRRAAELLETNAEDFMAVACKEAGKTIPDAIAEVREAVDFLRYYADQSEHISSAPLGVVACISPWNFPLAIFLGQVSAALAAGNAVVCKPAEQTPLIASEAVRLMHEAGVPNDVLNIVIGDGPTIGAPLVAHPNVKGVVFTGSTEVAKLIHRSLVDNNKHDAALIAETGGINAMIIDSTALLEQAVQDTIDSAFQSAGQRCSACRVVCVQEDIADRFNEMLAGAMAELSVGDPALMTTDVGPVIDDEAFRNIEKHIARLENEARLIARAPGANDGLNGALIRPAAYEIGSIKELTQEIFGPVLHVVRFSAARLHHLIDDINGLGFGLTMGIHTRIDETMNAIAGSARIGNIYVNRNQIGAVVGVQPFGGEGLSGTGPKAGGPHYITALTKRQLPVGSGEIEFSDRKLNETELSILGNAAIAFKKWSLSGIDRGTVLKGMAATGGDGWTDALQMASEIYNEEFAHPVTLPGPTGESNTLRLRGRGVALCLAGGDEKSNYRQIALALAAGNSVIIAGWSSSPITKLLAETGAPDNLVQFLPEGQKPPSLLLQQNQIRLVACDATIETRHSISSHLARRDSAIIPLLSSKDAPWRFAVERTLTINTTAAGGDVRLLSLSE